MINITNIDLLKITKVRDNKINFKYDEQRYLLYQYDSDSELMLFRRDLDSNGRYINTLLCKNWCRVSEFIRDVSKKKVKNITYTNIDKELFVKMLLINGFSTGLYEKQFKEAQDEKEDILAKIEKLRNRIEELDTKFISTRNHGSKQYTDKIKDIVAERIIGKDFGEYCEEYRDFYGNRHPLYGGVLTDLRTLPVGTSFYVANGAYPARIVADKHGDKCILNPVNMIKLTDTHNSLYIE